MGKKKNIVERAKDKFGEDAVVAGSMGHTGELKSEGYKLAGFIMSSQYELNVLVPKDSNGRKNHDNNN